MIYLLTSSCKNIAWTFILCLATSMLFAQTTVGTVATTNAGNSCKLVIANCEGDILTLAPQDQASYTNYKWYFGTVSGATEITAANAAANNVVATDFALNFPTIKVVSGGGTYILTAEFATPASCATKNDTFELNFTPRPAATNASLVLCETTAGVGTASFTLTGADATVTGGASGVAVTYHATLADAQGDATPLSSPYTSGTATLFARVENTTTGCYRTATLTLTVNPLPTVTDPSDQIVCNGSNTTAVTFGGSAVSGTTYSWTNNTTSIGLAASGTGNIAAFAATNATSSPITATITVTPTANSCPGTPQTFTITVNPSTTITALGSNPTTCGSTNGSVTVSGLVSGTTYTVNYTGTAGTPTSGSTAVANASGEIAITGLGAGTYTNISVSRLTCPSNTIATVTLTDPSSPTVADPSDQIVCSGANTTTVTFSGTAGATFNWTNSATSIGLAASGTGNIAAFAATNTGTSPVVATIIVTPTLAGCTGTAQTFTITVNPLPDFTLAKPVACPGTSEEVNITIVANIVAATAQLKIDAGAFAAYPSPAILTGLAVGSHTFTVKNAEGCETAKNITVNAVNPNVCLPVTVTRSN